MKHFAKLALVSAIAMSSSAFAMETMEDEALAETTGQDGVTISITPPAGGITMSTLIHDSDGWAASASPAYVAGTASAGTDGVIVIGNPLAAAGHTATSISTGANPIVIDIDAAADVDGVTAGSQGAALGIKVTLPATTIQTGTISAASSNGTSTLTGGTQTGVIMDNLSISLNGAVLFMTLGNEATGGQMMRFGSTLTGGLTLNNFALRDANGGGTGGSAIRAGQIKIDDAGAGNDLLVDAKVDVKPTGLEVNLVTVGSGGMDVKIQALKFGDTTATAPAIGNVDVVGLNLAGTIIGVRGH